MSGPSTETIGDAVQALAEGAIAGLYVTREAVGVPQIPANEIPHLVLLQIDYDASRIDWQQIERTWTFRGTLVRKLEGQTRDTIAAELDAIRDAIYADPTLGGIVDTTLWTSSVPDTHVDDEMAYGLFDLIAEWTT